MRRKTRRRLLATTIATTLLAGASTALAHPFHLPFPPPPPPAASFTDQVFFNGATLRNATSGGSEALSSAAFGVNTIQTSPGVYAYAAGAIFLAIYIGLRATLLVGGALYLCAFLVIIATKITRRPA